MKLSRFIPLTVARSVLQRVGADCALARRRVAVPRLERFLAALGKAAFFRMLDVQTPQEVEPCLEQPL
jgi:hypothetical protein